MNVSAILDTRYDSLSEAQDFRSPGKVVVSDNGGETFYIVDRDVFNNGLIPLGYEEIVVEDGE
jgi:hypothetical protein